jgi:hypothetical protein
MPRRQPRHLYRGRGVKGAELRKFEAEYGRKKGRRVYGAVVGKVRRERKADRMASHRHSHRHHAGHHGGSCGPMCRKGYSGHRHRSDRRRRNRRAY